MFLNNIPAHYLIPDPSFLQRETAKFSYIDPNWMDALIDGALSVGNHPGKLLANGYCMFTTKLGQNERTTLSGKHSSAI